MWLDIGSYILHWLVALFFFLLLPLPIFIKGMEGDNRSFFLRLYQPIIHLAHAGLIGSILTGFVLIRHGMIVWLIVVFLLWLVIGALLGLTAKSLRLVREHEEKGEESKRESKKLLIFSTWLSFSILAMFILKFWNWM